MRCPALLALFLTCLLVTGCGSDDPGEASPTDAPIGSPTESQREEPTEESSDAPPVADPCPPRFPTASSGEPAANPPEVMLTERTWVCRYSTGRDAWVLDGDPVPVEADALAGLQAAVGALEPARPRRICTLDLGPRFLLVTATRDGLTSVIVDDFGCHDVRVTDDPVADPAGGGALSGAFRPNLANPIRQAYRRG